MIITPSTKTWIVRYVGMDDVEVTKRVNSISRGAVRNGILKAKYVKRLISIKQEKGSRP
jgi:hypothetical protein